VIKKKGMLTRIIMRMAAMVERTIMEMAGMVAVGRRNLQIKLD
jgi:hypothetical protein